MMKSIYYLLLFWPLLTVFNDTDDKTNCKNSAYILEQSYAFHDPSGAWNNWQVNMHIQEPRIQNPQRYSMVNLNKADNSFNLIRNRDENISEHKIDKNGEATVLFNNSTDIPASMIDKYRLDPSRNISYKDFYETMYGLPMSLKGRIASMNPAETIIKDNQEIYVIDVKLNKPMFTDHWKIAINKTSFQIEGVQLINDQAPEKGEILEFEELVELDGIKVPRIRHWYEPNGKAYQGSDIIVKRIE